PLLPLADVVDLEPELHGQTLSLRVDDRVDVEVEVVDATLALVLLDPDLAGLAEVVDVLREADLVDAALGRRLQVRPHSCRRVVDLLRLPDLPAAEMHVVVDDHGPRLCGKGAGR